MNKQKGKVIKDEEFAEMLVRGIMFMDDVIFELFAMRLFLKKRGLYREYLEDKELEAEVKAFLDQIAEKLLMKRKELEEHSYIT